jgi:signal recognition particle subunit SEC65
LGHLRLRKCLARDGRLVGRTTRQEYISEEELMAKLHQAGIERLGQANVVYPRPTEKSQ